MLRDVRDVTSSWAKLESSMSRAVQMIHVLRTSPMSSKYEIFLKGVENIDSESVLVNIIHHLRTVCSLGYLKQTNFFNLMTPYFAPADSKLPQNLGNSTSTAAVRPSRVPISRTPQEPLLVTHVLFERLVRPAEFFFQLLQRPGFAIVALWVAQIYLWSGFRARRVG